MNRKNMLHIDLSTKTGSKGPSSGSKRTVLFALLIMVVLVGLAYVVLGPAKGRAPKNRPVPVPIDAMWVGGADGGAYVRCRVDVAKNTDYCEVWNDSTGRLSEAGDYQVRGQARAATKTELADILFPDFAGHIYLAHNVILDRQ